MCVLAEAFQKWPKCILKCLCGSVVLQHPTVHHSQHASTAGEREEQGGQPVSTLLSAGTAGAQRRVQGCLLSGWRAALFHVFMAILKCVKGEGRVPTQR